MSTFLNALRSLDPSSDSPAATTLRILRDGRPVAQLIETRLDVLSPGVERYRFSLFLAHAPARWFNTQQRYNVNAIFDTSGSVPHVTSVSAAPLVGGRSLFTLPRSRVAEQGGPTRGVDDVCAWALATFIRTAQAGG